MADEVQAQRFMDEKIAALRARLDAAEQLNRDHEEVHADRRRLVREMDVMLHGDGAAKQAALCDMLAIVARLKRERDSLRQRVERMSDVLALDEPWPLFDVLDKLRAATVHLLDFHACDTHGHEEYKAAMMQAETIITRIKAALKET
jgi:hypothetical protein